jgi:GDP-L-fucose synthase
LWERNVPHCGGSRRLGVDATNLENLTDWIKDNKITHLVNLAADCGGIGLNQKIPATLWAATTQISHTVLDAALRTKIQKLVMVGTVCSYAKHCPVPFKEEDLMRHGMPEPTNRAYGVAKLNSLIGAQAYAKQHGMKICNLIPVNMYGPYDHCDPENSHVIPALIRKFDEATASGGDVTIWGTGSASREFLYARDFGDAVLRALDKLEHSELINVGTGTETSIKSLVETIGSLYDFKGKINWDTSKPDGQPRRCIDATRATKEFGFKAKTELHDGLKRTIEWYRATKDERRP